MNVSKIKDYFKNFKKITKTSIDNFKKENKEDIDELEKYLKINPEWESLGNLISGIVNDFKLGKCKICGKTLKYYQSKKGYDCCSKECKSKNSDIIKKMQQTCLEKYGETNPGKVKEFREKIKNTCIKKYGVESHLKTNIIKEKIKNTFIEKYGVSSPILDKNIKEKIKNTCKEKYGNETTFGSKEIQEKIKRTFNKKYGVDFPLQNKEILKETIKHGKETNLLKTGFENANTFKGWKTIESWKDYIIPMFEKKDYKGAKNPNIEYEWKCVKCGNIFKQRIYFSAPKELEYIHRKLPRCLKCYPMTSGFSYGELEVFNFVKQYFPTAHKDRKLINPLEIDIIIPELKLGIEFNGNYYHSIDENFGVPSGYHLNKVKACNEKGYRLIHIWEDEWIDDPDRIKNRLKEILEKKENLVFEGEIVKLDRSWYNNIEIPGYELIEETVPTIVQRHMYDTENCGYLIYRRIDNEI